MDREPPLTLVDPQRARDEAERLFQTACASLASILPSTADIRHVGATAVPGCLTKGDLDIVIRVPAEDFEEADSALASRFSRKEGSVRTPAFSAFEEASGHPHLGIQLAAINGPYDVFHLFAEALRASPDLVAAYNALKRHHDGCDMAGYRSAKDAFIEKVLADIRSGERADDRPG